MISVMPVPRNMNFTVLSSGILVPLFSFPLQILIRRMLLDFCKPMCYIECMAATKSAKIFSIFIEYKGVKPNETQTDDSMTIKVYADGNALVYEYQFTDEYDLSDEDIKQSVLDALKEGCEENASTFEDIADTLESEVGLSGVHVRLVYLNGDGSEIYTHDFE